MVNKDSAHKDILKLVERFEEQYPIYKSVAYNEANTRKDFIDPFFTALGWDMNNSAGNAEAYREVIHEDKLKVSGGVKAPDYSFKLPGGKRLFFVEAKKPHIIVKDDIIPAYQVRRYGWSAKMPISIITDFEEFAVYDCTKKPLVNDKASVARIRYLTFRDYDKEFDFLYDTFSKEKVLKGSFDQYIQSDKNKKGTTSVDKEFLKSLDEWRTYLATSISINNKNLNEEEINFAVQQLIDRIIFLRIAEDRSVEKYGNLKLSLKSGDYYHNLFDQFSRADEKYNSGLFDFKKDKISQSLKIDNKIIKNIISDLYYPESPYEFSVLSVEILGSAYEQFLGKQIRIDSAHRARIEEKPEVRKAGGVYYTPEYIVEYIVKNTVGKKVEGKTPEEISKLKIVDPACGSGSFLLGAFQFLLDFHKNYYKEVAMAKTKKATVLTPDGNLTTAEKKRILLNNIFGVDIDLNAVEVTKLSLLLKCMEGETEASITHQMQMFNERVLPTLDENIKCGNSLVDIDFYDGQMDFGEDKKVKPFSWKKKFLQVFKQGGFDVVIGNPPYVRQELLGELKSYFQKKYKVYHGLADLYSYFIERGIELLNDHGLFGYIVANKWMRTNYGEPLRKWLKNQQIEQIIDFGDLPVFNEATTYPCIIICNKDKKVNTFNCTNIKSLDFKSLQTVVKENCLTINSVDLQDSGWNLVSANEQNLQTKICQNSISLKHYVNGQIYYGIKTGLNQAFVIDEVIKNQLINEDSRSNDVIKPFLIGREVKRYLKPKGQQYLIFIPKGFTNKEGKNPKNGWKWLAENYSSVAMYLKQFQDLATKRSDKGDYWWELRACEYYDAFEQPKIIYPNILKRPEFTFDTGGWFTNQKCFIISSQDKYLLGILNSKLFYYLFEKNLPKLRGGFYEPSYIYLKNFPIYRINPESNQEIQSKEQIISAVKMLLELYKKYSEKKLASDIEQIENQIQHCENKIDSIVFQLYGLNSDDVNIIEDTIDRLNVKN